MTDMKTIVGQAYAAFNKRDIDGALAVMTQDVSWPKASEGGKVIGKEEIRAYWTRQWSEFDPCVEPIAMTEIEAGKIRVTVHQLVKSLQGDVLADGEVLHVFTIKGGLIAAMDLGEGSAAPSAAFAHRPATSPAQTENEAWSVDHPCSAADEAAMIAMRAIVTPNKGKLKGVGARVPFNALVERTAAPEAITYQADEIGGVAGWWCRPAETAPDHAVIHLHGGWFTWGRAEAFRHLAGHLAAHAGVSVFVPDYRLAPEHPFPAAVEDVRACYYGLVGRGYTKIAVTGDSAGGNLALGLLTYLASSSAAGSQALAGAVAISPITDLSLSGESWSSRAQADPLFTRPQVAGLVEGYLAGHAANDPAASPLFANLQNLAPLRVHVGSDEVLLDDSVRFVKGCIAAGSQACLDVWQGMIHGFLGSIGRLEASQQAFQAIGEFLISRFQA